MKNEQIIAAVAKTLLSNSVTAGYLRVLDGHLTQQAKRLLNAAIFATDRLNKFLEKEFMATSITFAEDDTEMLDRLMDISILAEKQGRQLELKNDIFGLMQKYKK